MIPSDSPRLTDIRDTETLDYYLRAALTEDGAWEDATSLAIAPRGARARAFIISKAPGLFCGGVAAERVFHIRDAKLRVRRLAREGRELKGGERVMRIEGSLASILSAERTALNFAQRLSGVATLTRRYVDAIGESGALLFDTRKTTPLWRALERHAVRIGGGKNHRFALDDMIMIKDNHADAAGGVGAAVIRAREQDSGLRIAAEARTVAEAAEAAGAGADIVMLDNMSAAQVRRAVKAVKAARRRTRIEVTGGVTLRNAASLARAGAERLSVGAITHSAPALDLSLQIEAARANSKGVKRRLSQ